MICPNQIPPSQLTNGFQSLHLPGGLQVVPAEGEEYHHDNGSWDEDPVVGGSSRQNDSQQPQQQLGEEREGEGEGRGEKGEGEGRGGKEEREREREGESE